MRVIIIGITASLLWAFAAVSSAWAGGVSTELLLQQDPNLVNIPQFPSNVTNSIAMQHIQNDRTPRHQADLLPSAGIVSSNPQAGPTFDRQPMDAGIDRKALYEYASIAAKSAAMELRNAYQFMINDGTLMQFPFNPPAIRAAGAQVVAAATPHLQDAIQFDNSQWSTRRLADGGRLISRQEDVNHPTTLPAGNPPVGFPTAPVDPSNFHTPHPAAPGPFNPGPNGPIAGAPPPPTTYVYTGTDSKVDPVSRNVAPTLPPVYQQVLIDRGVNPDAFAADLASGRLNNVEDFLRAAGNTGYSSSDLAKSEALVQDEIAKLEANAPAKKAEAERHNMKEEKPTTGAVLDESLLMESLATARAKQRSDTAKATSAKDPSAATLPGISLPLKLSLLLAKHGKTLTSPVWYQWLGLGVMAPTSDYRHPQNIFHIAHRQYQNFAPIGRNGRDEVAVLDF